MHTYLPSTRIIALEKSIFHLKVRFSSEVDNDYMENYITANVSGYVWKQDVGKKIEFHKPHRLVEKEVKKRIRKQPNSQ